MRGDLFTNTTPPYQPGGCNDKSHDTHTDPQYCGAVLHAFREKRWVGLHECSRRGRSQTERTRSWKRRDRGAVHQKGRSLLASDVREFGRTPARNVRLSTAAPGAFGQCILLATQTRQPLLETDLRRPPRCRSGSTWLPLRAPWHHPKRWADACARCRRAVSGAGMSATGSSRGRRPPGVRCRGAFACSRRWCCGQRGVGGGAASRSQ